MSARTNAAFTALLAAALFGATTPLAKTLLGSLTPFMVAGLFYLGSGVGLGAFMLMRRLARGAGAGASPAGHARLPLAELPWLAGVRENVDAQIFAGMAAIVAGGVLLSWHPGAAGVPLGALLVAAACACWAIDNNLTRKVSTHDAAAIACVKGLVAGTVNLGIALALGARLPAAADSAAAMLTGFAGYGVSLVLFVVALRNLGTARTGAYFSVAPLFGVGLSLALWPEWPPLSFWAAAALMALGIWLHLRERHEHPHTHEALEHSHRHRHDTHHQHAHDFDWDGTEPHTHAHRHTPITHTHAHFPDIHHRHSH
ncbi:DMT family transporter [Burkholderia pseudomallei]|uniref:DMT family transporter n=1 Tax=Burkholderia pseudomallei TaxID=28450 RepID=UPI001605295B|nr:DMT family transporter [Burkholderia pseudomallei]